MSVKMHKYSMPVGAFPASEDRIIVCLQVNHEIFVFLPTYSVPLMRSGLFLTTIYIGEETEAQRGEVN